MNWLGIESSGGCKGTILTRENTWLVQLCNSPQSFAAQTSAVYQLQRRVRTLREQLQRRDLHLDLLRRKLSLLEENSRMRSLLETEKDEANLRLGENAYRWY
jgi:hypothetical protein